MNHQKAKPRILHISCSARRGGAAAAAWRLHRTLNKTEVDSNMVVMEADGLTETDGVYQQQSIGSNIAYRIRKNIEIHAPRLFYPKLSTPFSLGRLGLSIEQLIKNLNPDIINLHWINNGTLDFKTLRNVSIPIVWTMHDMWPFTGGCHYSGSCSAYETACGNCPQLHSNKKHDYSYKLLKAKRENLNESALQIVTPSKWLGECARRSRLYRNTPIHVLPNGVDTTTYTPSDKIALRRKLGIPEKSKCILFAAMNATSDKRKGFDYLQAALSHLKASTAPTEDIRLLIVGSEDKTILSNLPFPAVSFGTIQGDTAMAEAYACADIFVAPSLEDNLPNTVLESLSCGTPVVAFNIGGMPDMIKHQQTGYLAEPEDSCSLSNGIAWTLSNPEKLEAMSCAARRSIESRFTLEHQAAAYTRLYHELLDSKKNHA